MKKLDENKFRDIILNKIDYCVIFSIKKQDLFALDKENSDKKEENDDIISFYFLFNYLDDNDNSYNLIDNNVIYW